RTIAPAPSAAMRPPPPELRALRRSWATSGPTVPRLHEASRRRVPRGTVVPAGTDAATARDLLSHAFPTRLRKARRRMPMPLARPPHTRSQSHARDVLATLATVALTAVAAHAQSP